MVLYIVRGLPGSGKSTLARALAPAANMAADDYFERDGGYNFNPRQLGEAHADCQRRAQEAMADGQPVVAIHNTFSQRWEAEPYLRLAAEFGYSVQVIECQANFGSIHGVPRAAIEAMKNRWESIL